MKCIMKFSERYGYINVRKSLQIDSMDDSLRNSLWNIFYLRYHIEIEHNKTHGKFIIEDYMVTELILDVWKSYFKFRLNLFIDNPRACFLQLQEEYNNLEWYKVYDFIEFLISSLRSNDDDSIVDDVNLVLEREMSGYRCIDGCITRIVDENEIEAIETAINKSDDPISEHLKSALLHLSDRENPDFRNSIKESISAVESMVKIQTGSANGTLGKLLNTLQQEYELHPALKEAFSKLYGYASDEEGIRHGMMEGDNTDFHDAKFMLVACAAFVNYINGKYGE